MIRAVKYLSLVIAIHFACVSAEEPAKPHYKTENVVLMVIDGPRYSETWGDPKHQYIPHMANDLAKEGVIYTKFANNGNTLTDPGHTALTTGYYQTIDNSGKELPSHPTLLQMWLKSSGQPQTSAWLITSKDKLEILADTNDPEWKGKFRCSTDCGKSGLGSGYREDKITWDSIQKILPRDHPRLVVINVLGPDFFGHARDWEKYLNGIKDTDQYAWDLWQLLQKDPFYAGKTTLFITNDHGRHVDGLFDGFCSHGDGCPGCRHINCFAAGPDFKKNVILEDKREQIDIPITIAQLLGLSIPGSKGQVMTELFDNPSANADTKSSAPTQSPSK
jgi:hypothetical protein